MKCHKLPYEKWFFEGRDDTPAQVPEEFRNASLENCTKIPKLVVDFGYKVAKNPESILLCGSYGNGKTHFAFALIRQIMRDCPRLIWPRYFTSIELDSRLLAAAKGEKGDKEEVYERARDDLLFIDDLGRETKSDRLKRQYFEIFNYRYANKLPTIVTSNLILDQLGDIIDGAIASRMQSWRTIMFTGPDLRAKKTNVTMG